MKSWRGSRSGLLAQPALLAVSWPLHRSKPAWPPLYPVAKRACDVVFALLILMATGPLLIVAIGAVALSSPGPIFFGHERCGRGGAGIRCWKLRTMIDGAEARLNQNAQLAEEFTANHKLYNDPRVTGIGRVLRATSLDELPQLLNVFKGEMSLVGPRPVPRKELDAMYGESATEVFSVLPGITGLWQVTGRSSVSYEQRVQLDLEYVRSRSMRIDMQILVRTPGAVLSRRGAV